MIKLRVIRNDPPRDGYSAETDSEHYLLGLWLEGDVREGGDDYDIEGLWRSIGAHQQGDGPAVSQTDDAFTIRVEGRIATVWPNPFLAIPQPLVLSLDDFADATERWFDVVAPDVAASLRRIRTTWRTLLASARAHVPTDVDVRGCWELIVRGIEVDWLDVAELDELVRYLDEHRDFGVEELLFANLGDRLRVSFLDEQVTCASKTLADEIRTFVAALR